MKLLATEFSPFSLFYISAPLTQTSYIRTLSLMSKTRFWAMVQTNSVINGLLAIFKIWLALRLCIYNFHLSHYLQFKRPDSSVGTATRYRLDGPAIESRCGDEIFRTPPARSCYPPSVLYNGYRVFTRGKAAWSWRWPPTQSSGGVKERVEIYSAPPLGLRILF